ncbi:MAG: radical SAM protein [Oscillospiraceae bacterium]|nr:radical SAM protein [Oscillospiraceae bacterium]
MTRREARYAAAHLRHVRHITLDPRGPGVVRIHMLPPREDSPEAPFLLLLNGAQLVPLNLSWAILLSCLMYRLEDYDGQELGEALWEKLLWQATEDAHKVYPRTHRSVLTADLHLMLRSLTAIARGEEPEAEVEPMSLGEYATEMTAPHRMDIMVSAMTKEGCWHCNQKCLHCYAAGQPMGEVSELSTEAWKTLLTKLREANIPQVTFTGGEPTLRKDLVELISEAAWFVTRLNTNGRLLTPQLCHDLYEASLDSVQVTLYSADRAIHNTLVGTEGFDDTVAGIRNAVEAGLIVSVNTPLCSVNTDYAETLRFVHSLGVRYVTCSGLIPSGAAEEEESRATALCSEALEKILSEAAAVAHGLGMEMDFTSPGWLREESLHKMGLHLVPSCGACLSNMALTPDGTVVPCQSWLGGVTLGNLLTDEWKAIWEGEVCKTIRSESAKMEHICQLRSGNREVEA